MSIMDLKLPPRYPPEPSPNQQAKAHLAPTLGGQAALFLPRREPQQEQGGGSGKSEGAQKERPSHPSYYTQFSPTLALPKRDVEGQRIQEQERSVRRARSMSI